MMTRTNPPPLLAELEDATFGLSSETSKPKSEFPLREAARAIIFDANNIALLHATKRQHHKLPGGGIEAGEDWLKAMEREALEEVGCNVKMRPLILGQVIEWRGRFEKWHGNFALKQISVCGVADAVSIGSNALTEDEQAEGMVIKWVPLAEAIQLVRHDQPSDYESHFIRARELAFLEEALRLLKA